MENVSDVGTLVAEAAITFDDIFDLEERMPIPLPSGGVVEIPANPTQEFLGALGQLERVQAAAAKLFPADENARQSYPPLVAAIGRYLDAGCAAAPELTAHHEPGTVAAVLKRAWGLGKAEESSASSTSSPMS